MPDSSAISARRVFDAAQRKAKPAIAPEDLPALPAISPAGPRKLVRPPMPPGPWKARTPVRLSPLSSLQPTHKHPGSSDARRESSHAEAFYFQKQIQSQTIMVFVLEEGEEIEGQIEWYDRDAIKIRHGNLRTLIYKSGVKYLYKAADKGS